MSSFLPSLHVLTGPDCHTQTFVYDAAYECTHLTLGRTTWKIEWMNERMSQLVD